MKAMFVCMGAENLGVEYLAAEARAAGHEVSLAFDPAVFGGQLMWDIPALARRLDLRARIAARAASEKPDVAAFSCLSGNYAWALAAAGDVKAASPSTKIFLGGPHPTAVPERAASEPVADAIAVGEADSTFAMMLERAGEGPRAVGDPPPGVWEKLPGGGIATGGPPRLVSDLDSLPFPAKDLFYERVPSLQSHYMIMSARGCPYNCSYCYKSLEAHCAPGSNPVRRRSPENTLQELREAKARWRLRMVVFRDDVFTLNRKWLERFTEGYRRDVALPYFCYTHPAALDAGTADLIKEGGCSFVTIGVQSADEAQRREILNRKYTNDQARRAVALLKERGITVSVDHIAGIPGDTEEKLMDAARFYNEMRPDRLLTFWLTYYPGTRIMKTALETGAITEKDRERIESGGAGHRYSGGGAGGLTPAMKRMPAVMALASILPKRMAARFLDSPLRRLVPASFAAHNILLFVNAIKIKDPFFMYNIWFFLSRKRVP
ncbi:MAG TPA: radical SAM protein [bacterium]|nr:radical SAM protein [bacterium]